MRPVAELLALKWDEALADALANAGDLAASPPPAPLVAAELAGELYRMRPDAEMLAFWLSDALLAHKFRWPLAAGGSAADGTGRLAAVQGRRAAPAHSAGRRRLGRAVLLAYARAAAEACDLGGDLARRAARLVEVAPKLRAKGAADVVRLLLDDDTLPASWSSAKLSARGARRLFERLHALHAVRELSGRPAFRLYGL